MHVEGGMGRHGVRSANVSIALLREGRSGHALLELFALALGHVP